MSTGYSKEPLEKMQREAEKRVMEMRQRSKAAAESPDFQKPKPVAKTVGRRPSVSRFLELLNTDKMMSDPDSRLVLLLLALLAGEGADPMLLFSLLYIIL